MIDLRWLDLIDYLPLILEYLMMGCRAAMIPTGYRASATQVSTISTAKFQLPLSISWLIAPDGILSSLNSSQDGQFSLPRLASIECLSYDWHVQIAGHVSDVSGSDRETVTRRLLSG